MDHSECREKPILYASLKNMYLKFNGSQHIHKTIPSNLVNTIKLDSEVNLIKKWHEYNNNLK